MAISLTYTFTAGTRILSSQVNSNFSTLATRALDKTGDTMTGNLLFTDATYDIGASGATRPRDFFLSRNAVIGGTLGVTGVATFTAAPVISAGLQFPASQAASADANNLDDYEEGNWTPVLTFGVAGDLSVTYATQAGRYTKVGRKVTATATIITSAFTHTTASGSLQVTGLGITAAAGVEHVGTISYGGITKANYTSYIPRLNGSTAIIDVIASGSGQARSNVAAADMPTGGTVVLAIEISFFV